MTPTPTGTPPTKQASPGISVTVHTVYADESNAPATPTEAPSPTTAPAEAATAAPAAQTEATVLVETSTVASAPVANVKEGNDFVNVRSGPGTIHDLLGTLNAGQSAPVKGKNDGSTWWQIEYAAGPNGLGWVFGELVVVSGDPSTIAVMATSQDQPAPVDQPTAAPAVVEPPTAVPAQTWRDRYVDRDGSGSVTCDDFLNQADAQAAYEAGNTRLDGSPKNGRACDSKFP